MVVSFNRCGSCDIALLHAQLRCKETFEVMLALIQRGAELLKELVPEHAAGYGQNMSKLYVDLQLQFSPSAVKTDQHGFPRIISTKFGF